MVQFAAELRLHRVIFEGDSTIVINAVSQRNAALSSYGNIVDDIRCLVSSFLFFDFIHVHRTGNFVADALAKKAKNIVGCQVWLEELLKTLLLWPNLIFTSFCFLIYSRTLGLVSQKRKKMVFTIYTSPCLQAWMKR